jgi:hypothetical protein
MEPVFITTPDDLRDWFDQHHEDATELLVVSAKRPETRGRRLAQLITDSAAGRPVPPLTRR